jgi:hypothetical protein
MCSLILHRMRRLAGNVLALNFSVEFSVVNFNFCSSLAVSINGVSVDALISSATAASPRLMSVPQPVLFTLHVQPATACAATSTVSLSLTSMTAGIPITISVTVRDSFGNLRSQNSYSSASNMDNVMAVMYPLPAPPTPAKNFLNGFVPSGTECLTLLKCSSTLQCISSAALMMPDLSHAKAGSPSCNGCPAQIRSPFLNLVTRDAANVYIGWQFNATKAGNYKVVPSIASVGGLFATFYDRDTTAFAFTSAVRSSAPFGLDFSAASGNAVSPLLSAASIRWQGFIQPKHDGLHTLSLVPRAAASQDKVKVRLCSRSCECVRARPAATEQPRKRRAQMSRGVTVIQVWIENVVVFDSSSISATPTATCSFPLANTLYDIFVAYER